MKALMTVMVDLIEATGVVDSVERAEPDVKRLLFQQGWNLITRFICEHHPLPSKRAKKPKETIGFTTLKKDYYVALHNAEADE